MWPSKWVSCMWRADRWCAVRIMRRSFRLPRRRGFDDEMKTQFFLSAAATLWLLLSSAPGHAAEGLVALTRVLAAADDTQLQLDVLRGISASLKGQRAVAMPQGWDAVETKLTDSTNA